MCEGRCSRHGYVVPDTVQFGTCSMGRIDGSSLNGDVVYKVEFSATLCNPPVGARLRAKVVNVNRFGILAQGGIGVLAATPTMGIMDIIIAKQGASGPVLTESVVDLDGVRIGDGITIEVLGKRFELNDARITVVGRVLAHEPAAVANFTTSHVDVAKDTWAAPSVQSGSVSGSVSSDDGTDASGDEASSVDPNDQDADAEDEDDAPDAPDEADADDEDDDEDEEDDDEEEVEEDEELPGFERGASDDDETLSIRSS